MPKQKELFTPSEKNEDGKDNGVASENVSYTTKWDARERAISRLENVSPSIYQIPFELSNLNGTNGFQINGIRADDRSGFAVSSAGDINGDGYADFIMGAPYVSFKQHVFINFAFKMPEKLKIEGFSIERAANAYLYTKYTERDSVKRWM